MHTLRTFFRICCCLFYPNTSSNEKGRQPFRKISLHFSNNIGVVFDCNDFAFSQRKHVYPLFRRRQMEEETADLWAPHAALFRVDCLDCAAKVSSLVSIIHFPGVRLFLHVRHRRHRFLQTQHFPSRHLPKVNVKNRAGWAIKRPRDHNWRVPKQHSTVLHAELLASCRCQRGPRVVLRYTG